MSVGLRTFQVSQVDELLLSNNLEGFVIAQLTLGYSLSFIFSSNKLVGASNNEFLLVTQKNKVRVFKTIDACFNIIKPHCLVDNHDGYGLVRTYASLNIKISVEPCILKESL